MQLPKIDVKPTSLATLLSEMHSGRLQLPRFQRDFVWPLTKTRQLLDSLYKEFPVGTFFFWKAPVAGPSLIRPMDVLGIPEPGPGQEISYILDGQQRLTSLYAAINGIRIGSRDYGRICLDLDVASQFITSEEEGFEEDIFVYHTPDNERYISVRDLTGPDHLMVYESIPSEWRSTFTRADTLFSTYPFSVVTIQNQSLGDAIEIFQRINQAGKRLSRYDLVCANLWTESFDFRKQVNLLNERYQNSGFGAIHETIYTQTFSLIIDDKCTTASELSMRTEDVLSVWQRTIRSLELAVSFAANSLGVERAEFLPYRGILPVLAYYFYHAPTPSLTAQERTMLWKWFWRVTLSERYSSTSPSRMAEDAARLRQSIGGDEAVFTYTSRASNEAVLRTRMTSTTSALRNAFLCMLALRQPRNLKDNSPVDLSDNFFSNLKKAERHHIFPVGHLKEKGIDSSRVHQIANFCFIPADLNREIGRKPPAEYLASYRAENGQFAVAAASHLLPIDSDSPIWSDDYQAFLQVRSQWIADQLNQMVESTPDEGAVPSELDEQIDYDTEVDLTEIRLRDFIDSRLTAVVGDYYWKQTMPGDVIGRVKGLIADWQKRHPYEDRMQFGNGRRRLDFCDVSDYEKIFLKNWTQFEEFFQHKPTLQTHLTAYRTLRNCVQHNRPPTSVEQKMGEAAITWLRGILDNYDLTVQEYEDPVSQNGVEDDAEELSPA